MVLGFAVLLLFLSVPVFAATSIETLHEQAEAAEAKGDLSTAIAKYRQILKLNPQLAPAYNNLGALYFKQGNFPKAAGVLKRALKVDPRMRSASVLLGMSLLHMSEYKKARPSLEAAVKEKPSDVHAQMLLVSDLTKLGDFKAAEDHLRRVVRLQANDQHAWYLLARIYIQLGQKALGKVNEINPHSVWAYEISAQLMESMKNYDGAVVAWKKAIAAAPQQPGVHYQLGDLYWSHSDWGNATKQFELEKQIDPRDCLVDWKLGDILMRKSVQSEKALNLEDKALSACPHLYEAHADHARLLLRLHQDQKAIPELKMLEKHDPSKPRTHFLLSKAYRAAGNAEQAMRELKTFSQLETKAREGTAKNAQQIIEQSQSNH